MLLQKGMLFLAEEGFCKRDLRFEGAQIVEIAEQLEPKQGEEVIDCTDRYIMPGMIDAHSHIGLFNEAMRWEGEDGNEGSDPITPEMRAIDGINPFDESFGEAIRGGVTTACTGPGSANVIGGSFATITLTGTVVDDMILKQVAAMKCAFGENPKGWYGQSGNKAPITRMGVAALLRGALVGAQNYRAKKLAAADKGEHFDLDPKQEALLPVLEGEIPLKAHAHRADDICTSIRIAEEFGVRLTLEHCTEGHLIADHIAQKGLYAMVGPTFGTKSKPELRNLTFETARVLNERGVKISLITDHPVIPQGALGMCAALAVKAGLPEIDALKAVTCNPAEAIGIADRKGALKAGLDADIVIWDRHPLDLQAQTMRVFICGAQVLA